MQKNQKRLSKAIVILYRVRYNKNVVKEQKKKPKPKGKEEFIMNITVYSYTDKTIKKQISSSLDVALYIVDLLESFGGITPEDGKRIPGHEKFNLPDPEKSGEECYNKWYQQAVDELVDYYSWLEVHDALEKLIELASSARLYYIDRTPYKVTVDGETVGNVSWDDGEGIWSWLSEQIYIDEDDKESQLEWEYLPDDNIKELLEAAQKGDFIGSFEIEEDSEEE